MIDLHIHTRYSDGTDDVITILRKADNYNLPYISITDHNNCKAYDELKNMEIDKIYKGKIISGVELNTKILGIPIEILGYGVNPEIINKEVKRIYISTEERNKIEVERLYKICLRENIKLEDNFIENYNANIYASKYLHGIITKYEENKKVIDGEAWEDSNIFYRKYMSNPETMFYIDTNDILPDFDTVSNLIKKAGGLVFIPHIYEYRDNAEKILKFILKNYKIDGIECYYTTFTQEQTYNLLKICKKKELFISGGSDYHGEFKPDVEMAIGKGNLIIPNEIIEKWVKKVI